MDEEFVLRFYIQLEALALMIGTSILFSFQGVESQSINAIRTDETVIISSSVHFSDPDMIRQQSYDDVEALKTKNALLVCSLENPGVGRKDFA